MTSDLHEWSNNFHNVEGDYDKHHDDNDSGDEDQHSNGEEPYNYAHYDPDTPQGLNNGEGHHFGEDRVASDTEAP